MSQELWNPRKPEAITLPKHKIVSVALADHAVARTIKTNLKKFSLTIGSGYGVGANINSHIDNYSASNSDKLTALQEIMEDPLVRVINCATGGYSAARFLREHEQQVYDLFNKAPKLWTGYSDAGVISMFLLANLDMVSASSPNAWGLYSDWDELSRLRLREFCKGETTGLYLDHSWQSQRDGLAEGVVITANLGTLRNSLGTSHDPLWRFAEKNIPVILIAETFSTTKDEVAAELDQIFTQRHRVNISGFVLGGRSPGIFAGPYKEFHKNNTLHQVVNRGLPPEIPWGVYKGYGHPEFGSQKGYKPKAEANMFMETIPFGVWGKLTLGDQCHLEYDCPVAI